MVALWPSSASCPARCSPMSLSAPSTRVSLMWVLQVGTILFVTIVGTNCAHAAMFVIEVPTLVWFIVGVAIGILFHEAGHALCAAFTGNSIRRVVIGAGPLVLRARFKDTKLELRVLPFGGYVIYHPAFPASK